MIPTLRKIRGASPCKFGRGSQYRDIVRGGQLKKNTLYMVYADCILVCTDYILVYMDCILVSIKYILLYDACVN